MFQHWQHWGMLKKPVEITIVTRSNTKARKEDWGGMEWKIKTLEWDGEREYNGQVIWLWSASGRVLSVPTGQPHVMESRHAKIYLYTLCTNPLQSDFRLYTSISYDTVFLCMCVHIVCVFLLRNVYHCIQNILIIAVSFFEEKNIQYTVGGLGCTTGHLVYCDVHVSYTFCTDWF